MKGAPSLFGVLALLLWELAVRAFGVPPYILPGPVAILGAFLADPALLILDEPTAHLDPPTRRALTADLLHATQDRSVLFITHQPDGLDQVDHIVVLDHGTVAEQGSHQQLRYAGGPYQRMRDNGASLASRSPVMGGARPPVPGLECC